DPRRNTLEAKAREKKAIQNLLFFGSGPGSGIRSTKVKTLTDSTQFTARVKDEEIVFSINSPALFMVDNCLAAICAARSAKICSEGIKKGIKAFTPVKGRMNIYRLSDFIHIIDDTYNANPASVTQALNTLNIVSKGKNSIAVLGDMLELGIESDQLHRQIGQKAALLGICKLFVFGSQVKHTMEGAIENGFSIDNIFHGTKDQIIEKLLESVDTKTWLLVKGSRSMAMETVIQGLEKLLTVT
ncbi:MAG: UDP-N-acetylmuramoyl-L-alanyl-D-glutamate--2,6-diaminopimelate ligase, partial [Desulfobacula sp.]|nr:UDP-N-acetylmuramoyl-L-alanyl-D-glutamate--2,6-diaminopimelate ligase [Desulfobacula sp.]